MAALNFPTNRSELDPPQPAGPLQDGDAFTDAGITWTWNATLGVWSTEGTNETVLDTRYLRVDAGTFDQTVQSTGTVTFSGRNVTISNNASPFFAGFDNGSDLITQDIYVARAQLQSRGTSANDIYIYSNAGGAQANTTGTLYAYHSNFESTHNNGRVYNFYAGGTAPNYFAGKITATANLELAGTQGDLTENPANSNTIGSAVRADGVISCNMSAADKYWHIRKNVASPYIQFSGNGLSTEGLIKRSSASVTTSGIIIGFVARIASDEVASAGIADALDTIKALTPNTKGFTVQDYSDYLPHLILDTDETGIDVDHVSVIPILTKALQETIAENEALKARVEALEAGELADDATDSALLTLVANLSTRIAALEAG